MSEGAGLEPTLADVQREFPGWTCYMSFGWCWAQLCSDPGVRVRGEDPTDLRDEIIRRIAQQDEKAWRSSQAAEASAPDHRALVQG